MAVVQLLENGDQLAVFMQFLEYPHFVIILYTTSSRCKIETWWLVLQENSFV